MIDTGDIIGIAIVLVMLFISIGLHEMMHAFTALRLGDDLAHSQGRISLNPLNHIDPFLTIGLPAMILLFGGPLIFAAKPVPINTNRISGDEMGLAAVGIAGPFTNFGLATLAALVLSAVSSGTLLYDILELFVRLNVGLFVFNMMPIPPLDGSRLLYAFAPAPVQRVMERIESLGIMVIIILLVFLLPILSPLILDANQFILDILIR